MQKVIGIDFGTSTTYMNVKRYNGTEPDGDKFSYMPVVFNYGESSGFVATVVRENADGSFDFGEKASEPLEGSSTHAEIKMRLESSNEAERADARRITKKFFQFLHETYVQQSGNLGSGDDEEETVVSYPVKWREDTAQFMLEAAREAGFRNVRGTDEAEAAVATVLCQSSGGKGLIYRDKPGYLLLIDMGAGTTDLVVCKYRAADTGIAIELVTSWPQSADEPTFGGREVDAVLSRHVEEYLAKALSPALHQLAHDMANAPGSAKKWKELTVSTELAAGRRVTTCGYLDAIRSMLNSPFPAFGREEFENFAGNGLRDYVRLLKGCLAESARRDAVFAANGLDLVILTGGHSAWYFAKEILTGAMEGWLDHPALARVRENPSRVVSLPNPQTTVSLGLVYSKLPYKLERQAPPAENADTNGKAEGVPEDADASYVEMARTFLAGRPCDPQMLRFARARLHIPDGEKILYAEGRTRGNADPGTYAIAESGIYLQGPFGAGHHLSWPEFVHAEWGGRAFAAPSWRVENNWNMSVPLGITRNNCTLKDLHIHLRQQRLKLESGDPQPELTENKSAQGTTVCKGTDVQTKAELQTTLLQQLKQVEEKAVTSETRTELTEDWYQQAVRFELGKGEQQSWEKAVYWYQRAAKKGHVNANNRLGMCYEEGHGVEQNIEQAIFWYGKAAEQGNVDAQNAIQRLTGHSESSDVDFAAIVRQVIAETGVLSRSRINRYTRLLADICKVPDDEGVLLTYDNTLNMNGKGGLVLTNLALYSRQWPLPPGRYPWEEFVDRFDEVRPCLAAWDPDEPKWVNPFLDTLHQRMKQQVTSR